MPTPNGPRNQPRYDVNDVPSFPDHLTEVSEYAALVGNLYVGTAAQRAALNGAALWDGAHFYETDTKLTWRYAGGWELNTAVMPRLRGQRPGTAGINANSWTSISMTSSGQEGGSIFTGPPGAFGSFTTSVTGRYLVNLKAFAPATGSPNRRIIGLSPSSTLSNPLTQSPGFGGSGDSITMDHTSEVTLTAGIAYAVTSYSSTPLNFTNYDVSVRLLAPTSIG